MSYASTVPGALAGLVSLLRAAPALQGVEITDGPPVGDSAATEAISVGWSPSEDVDAAEVNATAMGLAGFPASAEQVIIHCSLGVLNGAGDLAAARARAYVLHAAVGQAIAGDATLRGAVASAELGDHSLRQSDTTGGMLARINFPVRATGFTR